MDTIDEIRFDFELKTEHLDLHGIPAPWLKLYEYENVTKNLTDRFTSFDNARQQIGNFDDNSINKVGFMLQIVFLKTTL